MYKGILDIKFCGFKKITGVMHRLAHDSPEYYCSLIQPLPLPVPQVVAEP